MTSVLGAARCSRGEVSDLAGAKELLEERFSERGFSLWPSSHLLGVSQAEPGAPSPERRVTSSPPQHCFLTAEKHPCVWSDKTPMGAQGGTLDPFPGTGTEIQPAYISSEFCGVRFFSLFGVEIHDFSTRCQHWGKQGRHLKMTEKAVSEAGEEALRSHHDFSLTTETSGSPGLRTA